MKEEMRIKTNEGIGEPMSMTDLQRNNILLEKYNKISERYYRMILAFLVAFVVLIVWIIWKILSTGAVNNFIASCV